MLGGQEERTLGKGNMSGQQSGTDLWKGPRAEVQAVGLILKWYSVIENHYSYYSIKMGCREAQRDTEGRVRRLVTGIGSEMNQLTVIEMGRRGQNPEPQRWSQWSILVSSLSVPWGVSGSQKLHLSPMGHAPEVNNLSPCGPMPILSVGLDEEINLLLKMQVCEWSIRAGGGNSAIFLAHEPVYSFHLEPQHFEAGVWAGRGKRFQ